MHTVQGTMDMLDMHQTAALPPIAFPLMSLSTYSEIIHLLVALSQIGAGTSPKAVKIGGIP